MWTGDAVGRWGTIKSVPISIGLSVNFCSPHLTYPLRVRWHIRPRYTAFTCPVSFYCPRWRPTIPSQLLTFLLGSPTPCSFFGRPTLRFPPGCQVSAVMQIRLSSFLSTWPIHFHLLLTLAAVTKKILKQMSSIRNSDNVIKFSINAARPWAFICFVEKKATSTGLNIL